MSNSKRRWKYMSLGLIVLWALLAWPLAPAPVEAQTTNTCTITVLPNSYVTMGDNSATLGFTVTNTSPSWGLSINDITLEFDAGIYDLHPRLSSPPVGWQITDYKMAGTGQTWIRYTTSSAPIQPGGQATFSVALVGVNNAPFQSSPTDVSDQLSSGRTIIKGSGTTFACGTLPTWPRKALRIAITPIPLSLPVGQALRVELLVANRSTLTQNGILPTLTFSGNGGITLLQGPIPATLNLASGLSSLIVYTYTTTAPGNIIFSASVARGTQVTSGVATSQSVIIGPWTAGLRLSTSSLIPGQDVQVWLDVRNNTLPSAGNVIPSLTFVGSSGVSATLIKGPTPNKINSIPPGSVGTFEWTYRINGPVGGTFFFQGYAADKDGRTTNTAVSETGVLERYLVLANPARLASGSTNVASTFTVYNNGATPINTIEITLPPGWTLNLSASGGGYTTLWTKTLKSQAGKTYLTFSTSSDPIPMGQQATFTLTFSSIPTVTADTSYGFGTALFNGNTYQGGDTPLILVTRYKVTLSVTPSSLPADGASTVTLIACVSEAGTPVRNVWVSFTTTAGTLAAPIAQTTSSGCASLKLTAPISVQAINATVIASYLTAESQAKITFTGYNNANPLYVGGTLTPVTGQPGESIALRVDAINLGTRDVVLTTASRIYLTDGTRVYQATLSIPILLPVDGRRTLTFSSTTLDPAFTPGSYYPTLYLTGDVNGTITAFDRPVTDPFAVGAAALRATLSATPSLVVPRMDVTIRMTVRNYGLYPAQNVSPSALVTAGSGSVNLLSGPTPASVPSLLPDQETTFTWVYRANGLGQVTWSGQANGTDTASDTPISSALATSNVVTIARPGELSATFTGPATVNVNQTFSIYMSVTNVGGVAVNTIVPDPPTLLGGGRVVDISGPEPDSLITLAPGESGSFTWTYQAITTGNLSWNGPVSGLDSVNGNTVATMATPHILTIQKAASLRCALQARPLIAPTGHTVYITMTVTNDGEANAVGVAPSSLTTGGSGAVTLLGGPLGAPVTIPGHSSRQFTWQYRAAHSGTASWRGFAQGTDSNTDETVNSASCDSNSITIQPAAYLISTLNAVPEAVGLNEIVTVRMRVDNVGEVEAQNVAPSALTLSDATLFQLTGGPTPANVNIAAGQSITFTWTYRSANNKTGANTWRGNAAGRDALTGALVSSAATTSNAVYVYDVVPEKVARTSSPGYAQPNEVFTYEITLRNTSNQDVALQSLRDTLPVGIAYVETVGATIPPLPPTVSGQNVTWTWSDLTQIPVIRAKGVFTLTFKARVGTTANTYCNTLAFTRSGGETTLRSNLACFELGWREYIIITRAGEQRIRVHVRIVNRRPVILSWEYLP